MCTLYSWAYADRVYSFVQLGPNPSVGADILRLIPQPCRKFFLNSTPNIARNDSLSSDVIALPVTTEEKVPTNPKLWVLAFC